MINKYLLFGLAYVCTAINLELYAGKDYCFGIKGGAAYQLEYVVSGVNQRNIRYDLKRNNKIIQTIENKSEYSTKLDLKNQVYSACFRITDYYGKMLSLNFYDINDPLSALITKQQLKSVENQLKQAIVDLQGVYRNQHYQMQRDNVHKLLLDNTETRIKFTGLIKIFVLISAALLQLWVMKNYLIPKDQRYQAVQS